ncbi:acyl-CoA N-acyltransferase [Mycena vitilis]|nr:acyl-CoA N-acyltransferase [Mycena vitilis]
MSMTLLTFRLAEAGDAAVLPSLVQRAYRGDGGWTTEKGMFADQRVDDAQVLKKIQDEATRVLVAVAEHGSIIGCCEIVRITNGSTALFGMFAVDPQVQATGLGRRILEYAEKTAKVDWGVERIEITVIEQREELVAWYERRGYTRTGETRPFPYHKVPEGQALRSDLHFVVLDKTL